MKEKTTQPYNGTATPKDGRTGWATAHTVKYHYYQDGEALCKRFKGDVLHYSANPPAKDKYGFCNRLLEAGKGNT